VAEDRWPPGVARLQCADALALALALATRVVGAGTLWVGSSGEKKTTRESESGEEREIVAVVHQRGCLPVEQAIGACASAVTFTQVCK
jgi:hypothetical protein